MMVEKISDYRCVFTEAEYIEIYNAIRVVLQKGSTRTDIFLLEKIYKQFQESFEVPE